jgi:hypothetical protein
VVFVMTWLLHGYQSFWLRGRWILTAPDLLFWGILGALVLVNIQNDARRSRGWRRTCSGGRPDLPALAVRGLKILGTFCTMALLWGLWSSPSVSAFLALLRRGLP